MAEFKLLSEYYSIDPDLFAEKQILNPTINSDTRLFIDPLLLRNSAETEFNTEAVELYQAHFQYLFEQILLLKNESLTIKDKNIIEARILRKIVSREKKGLCLGFSQGNNRGRGIGVHAAKAIKENAERIILAGIEDPLIFHSVFLLEEGIGPDFISDMTAKIIEKSLFKFTQRISLELNIPTKSYRIDGILYNLPKHPLENTYINFVPFDILNKIPAETDFEDIMSDFINTNPDNSAIRNQVNDFIADILASINHSSRSGAKERIREKIIEENLILELSKFINNYYPQKYNISSDPDGLLATTNFLNWIKNNHIDFKINNSQSPGNIVKEIIQNFANFISTNNDVKRHNLYDGTMPKKEKSWQNIFATYTREIFNHNDLDLTPEFETGMGPVDFKISRGSKHKIIVELKLSSNTQYKHGLEKQLELYKNATGSISDAYYIFVDLETNPHKSNEKCNKLRKLIADKNIKTNLVIIEGKILPSASI